MRDAVLPMASTTKIMTAIVAIEQGDIDRTYTVKPEYTQTEGSSMYLKPGETVSIRDYLVWTHADERKRRGTCHCGRVRRTGAFVQAMNDKAEALALTNTHFENPNGLDGETHHTTARELAELTAYALQNPDFREIVSTKNITCAGRTMVNHNKMLSLYEGAIGVKTGYTKKCGRCLVSAAERNGRTLIAVTLNDPDDWNDHCTMLDEAFAQYTPVTLHEAGDTVGEVTVEGGTAQSVPLIAGHEVTAYLAPGEQVTDSLRGRPFVYATVAGGDYYGEIVYQIGEHILKTDTLSYAYDVEQLPPRKGILERCLDFVRGLFD